MAELPTSYTISASNDSTLAIEVCRPGLRRRKKHTLFFDKFKGEMTFAKDDLAAFKLALSIDAHSVGCFDARLNAKKRQKIADFARNALTSASYPEIQFTSTSLRAKPLRGFIIEGVLRVRGITRVVKMNVVLSPTRKDSLQLDGDAAVRLSDFELPRPSSWFGLYSTKDEAPVRVLLWATPTAEASHAATCHATT